MHIELCIFIPLMFFLCCASNHMFLQFYVCFIYILVSVHSFSVYLCLCTKLHISVFSYSCLCYKTSYTYLVYLSVLCYMLYLHVGLICAQVVFACRYGALFTISISFFPRCVLFQCTLHSTSTLLFQVHTLAMCSPNVFFSQVCFFLQCAYSSNARTLAMHTLLQCTSSPSMHRLLQCTSLPMYVLPSPMHYCAHLHVFSLLLIALLHTLLFAY